MEEEGSLNSWKLGMSVGPTTGVSPTGREGGLGWSQLVSPVIIFTK